MSKFSSIRRTAGAAGVALAASIALAACGGGNDTPQGAVENFLDNGVEAFVDAISAGDFDKAVDVADEYLCASDVESIQGMADMVAEMSDDEREMMMGAMGEEDLIPDDWSYEVKETSEDGDTATVTVEMTGDGETTTETIDVVKEDDEWKLCGFDL